MVALRELQNLSPLAEEAFIEFEAVCRDDMGRTIDALGPNESWEDARLEYMSRVQAAADEFGIEGADSLGDPERSFSLDDYRWFNQAITKLITRMTVRALRRTSLEIVELEPADRAKLIAEIERLKNRVEGSTDLDATQKASVKQKLDALLSEVKATRFDFAKFGVKMAAVAAALTAVGLAQDNVIKAPQTLVALMDMAHMVRGKEEHRQQLLQHYRKPKELEHKPSAKAAPRDEFIEDLDDEIPF